MTHPDYTPDFNKISNRGAFRFWCQKVLPLVYDDSLSYYELLCKVIEYLNNTMNDVKIMGGNVDSLKEAYTEFQNYLFSEFDTFNTDITNKFNTLENFVNTYFDELDLTQEVSDKLDEMASSGALSNLLAPLIPSLVTSWLNDNVTPVGGAVVVDESLTIQGAAADSKATGTALSLLTHFHANSNLFDANKYTPNKEYNSYGEILDSSTVGLSDYISVLYNQTIYFYSDGNTIPNYRVYYAYEFDKNKNWLRRVTLATSQTYTPNRDAYFVRFAIVPSLQYKLIIIYGAPQPWSPSVPSNPTTFNIMAGVGMFNSVAAIGDSFTEGLCIDSSGEQHIYENISYISTLAKRAGVSFTNYGVSGASAETYNTISRALPRVLSENPHDLYIINLGQNDVNNGSQEGSISDIRSDWTLNPNTYYGNMGKIISKIQQHAPNAKIVLVKSWLNTNKYGTDIPYQKFDSAIQEIANYFYIPCIAPFDDDFFNSSYYIRIKGHPLPMSYNMMGIAMERLFSKCVLQNPNYFKNSTIG